ncbi:hypothetical protein PCE1_002549 [Barthelona sp. PCE]
MRLQPRIWNRNRKTRTEFFDDTEFDMPKTAPICLVQPSSVCEAADDYTWEHIYELKKNLQDASIFTISQRIKDPNLSDTAVIFTDKMILWFNPIFYYFFILFSPYHSWYYTLLNSSSSEYIVSMEKTYRFNPPSDYEPDTTEDEVYINESEKLKNEGEKESKNDATLKAMQGQIFELQDQVNQQTDVVKVDLEPSDPYACDEPHQVSRLDSYSYILTV